MKIRVKIIKSKKDKFVPMFADGGVYRDENGVIRLYYAPF